MYNTHENELVSDIEHMNAKSNSTMKYGKTRSSELYVAAIFKMIAERAIST